MNRRIIFFCILIIFAIVIQIVSIKDTKPVEAYDKQEIVYIVKVEQTIERGLESFLVRAFTEAEESYADLIIMEINTPGGEIGAATNIGELILSEEIPVIAFVQSNAISAGSYISLCADKIYMKPNSSIGDAAVRTIIGDEVDPKITSYWINKMEIAASHNGKNTEIAIGMVDPSVEIPGITKSGQLITLDSKKALEYGIADGIVNSREELLSELDLGNVIIEEIELSPAEKLARFVTSPYVTPFLLIIGIAGLLVEIFVPGFGVPGIVGITSFVLYFFGHYIAGFAGVESIVLFVLGIILMSIELFVPGFGVFGILGIASLGFGISLAAYNTTYGLISLLVAFIVNIILAIILTKYFGHRGVWNRFILKEEQRNEEGYISHKNDKKLIGTKGITITKLRPSGAIKIDGIRYDVVSDGDFIDINKEVEVIMVEGTRIVVSELK